MLWFHELDTVIRRHHARLDWNVFIEQARRMEQSAAVGDVLTVLVKTFRFPLHDSVVAQLTAPFQNSSSPLCSAIDKAILVQSLPDSGEEFALLATLPTFKDKLRYIFSLVFPSPQYMARRYGTSKPAKLVGWYLARSFRIGAEGVRFAVTWITTVRRRRHSQATNTSSE